MKQTERRNPRSVGIDRLSVEQALRVFHAEDRLAAEAAASAAEDVSAAAEWAAASFRAGGRLVYAGAGTSGRLGALDAAECPPTFGVPPETVVGLIAGGDAALRKAVEGAEDSPEGGAQAVREIGICALDTFIGVSASGTAPYVLGALKEAKRLGAKTALLCCAPPNRSLDSFVDRQICAVVGPEIIAGSTRLKAGTATKLILNQISTIAMIQTGKVYDNWMVNVQLSNRKLRRRALRLVMTLGEAEKPAAQAALDKGGSVKAAVVMLKRGVNAEAAERLLHSAGGNLRTALERGEADSFKQKRKRGNA